jgi:hypothetical protein
MPEVATEVTLTQIGTVEVLRLRVYPLPGAKLTDKDTAHVQPGIYPLMRQADGGVFWIMPARRSDAEVTTRHLDDRPVGGLMALNIQDNRPSGKPFMILSPVFTAEEFADWVADSKTDPETPVRFTLTEG